MSDKQIYVTYSDHLVAERVEMRRRRKNRGTKGEGGESGEGKREKRQSLTPGRQG